MLKLKRYIINRYKFTIIKIDTNLYGINTYNKIINNRIGNKTLLIQKEIYKNSLFLNEDKNIYENIGLITNNTTFKIIKNNENNINPYNNFIK